MQEGAKIRVKKLNKTIGIVVEKYRKQQGKSAYRISAESGLSKSSWREVELGVKDVRISTLWKVAEGLDIPMDKLLIEIKKELGEDFSLSGLK